MKILPKYHLAHRTVCTCKRGLSLFFLDFIEICKFFFIAPHPNSCTLLIGWLIDSTTTTTTATAAAEQNVLWLTTATVTNKLIHNNRTDISMPFAFDLANRMNNEYTYIYKYDVYMCTSRQRVAFLLHTY